MDRCHHQKENPSFSSTLLDAIYRSIDESNGKGEDEVIFYRENMRKKQQMNNGFKEEGERIASLQKACMIEKWMEEKVSYQKVSVRRKSNADFDKKTRKDFNNPRPPPLPVLLNSSSSSSESSCGGGFSSSESESVYGLTMQRPKPIRTSISARPERYERPIDDIGLYNYKHDRNFAPTQKPSSFVKTKSKALKIYGDLKKVKQPISPGGRLASFLNSLFTAGSAKKAKISSPSGYSNNNEERQYLKSEQTSACSSASSFSRSCLSKTPSTRGNKLGNNGAKRSVRFYPVSVIVDEDSRPCGHKSLYANQEDMPTTITTSSIMAVTGSRNPNEELRIRVLNESRRVEEVARNLLKNYQKKNENNGVCSGEEEEEEDDDDAASYSSSDLFELDNLSAIGIERYRQELPVYETTRLDTNRAIANGLIV